MFLQLQSELRVRGPADTDSANLLRHRLRRVMAETTASPQPRENVHFERRMVGVCAGGGRVRDRRNGTYACLTTGISHLLHRHGEVNKYAAFEAEIRYQGRPS